MCLDYCHSDVPHTKRITHLNTTCRKIFGDSPRPVFPTALQEIWAEKTDPRLVIMSRLIFWCEMCNAQYFWRMGQHVKSGRMPAERHPETVVNFAFWVLTDSSRFQPTHRSRARATRTKYFDNVIDVIQQFRFVSTINRTQLNYTRIQTSTVICHSQSLRR